MQVSNSTLWKGAKVKTLQDQLKSQIEKLTVKLADSRQSLVLWQERVAEQETELSRLQKAWAAMNGMLDDPFSALDLAAVPVISTQEAGQFPTYSMKISQNEYETKLNGEKIILEPGFKIGKNSFGEDCIVPLDAADYPTMSEPGKPDKKATSILPAVDTGIGFDDPRDLR
jgi:hypothetical protein